ncbi:MAG TPA: type II secretion system protein [Thermoanaerobaculia bacterium]|nr:type II secretion system protein [Thermoanaerobaculia bacterium]
MRRQRGFSLAEVLVGVLILGIVVSTSLAVFVERRKRLQQAREVVLAYQVLANEAELQKRKAWGSVKSGAFESGTALLASFDTPSTIVSVKDISPTVKNVMLTIRWKNGEREAKLEIARVDTGGDPLW